MINQENIKDLRFKEMGETGIAISKEAASFTEMLQQMRVFNDDGELENYCLAYLRQKLSSKPIRAYYTRKAYEYMCYYPECKEAFMRFKDPDTLFKCKLPFLFEVIITIQYLHNHILDEKYDAKRQNYPKINQSLISSNILRELLFLYIDWAIKPHLPNQEAISIIQQKSRQLLLRVDLGQYIDKKINTYAQWKIGVPETIESSPLFDDIIQMAINDTIKQVKITVPGKSSFIDAYFRRIYLSNVYFFRCIMETIMELGGYSGEQHDRILVFSSKFGYMLQIINDYADFAYAESKEEQKILKTAGKKTTDLFADLYNFNITLPLIFHLRHGYRRLIEKYLEDGVKKMSILTQYPKQLMQEITQSGSIYETIRISRELGKSAEGYLDLHNPHAAYFKNMCDMANDNKFFQVFK